jgi:hypothetical protein
VLKALKVFKETLEQLVQREPLEQRVLQELTSLHSQLHHLVHL